MKTKKERSKEKEAPLVKVGPGQFSLVVPTEKFEALTNPVRSYNDTVLPEDFCYR